MALRYCPRCMQTQEDPLQCSICGFASENYQAPPYALPTGTEVGPFTAGIVLGTSRQAICYSAMDTRTGNLVLLEELFPPAAVKREGKNVIQANAEAKWTEAVERFAATQETDRKAQPIAVLRENQTAYRVYATELKEGQAPEELAEELLDHPIRFRDDSNKPLFSINALPILPLPPETAYTGGTAKQPKKETEKSRKGLLIAALVLILLALAGIAAWKLGWIGRLLP